MRNHDDSAAVISLSGESASDFYILDKTSIPQYLAKLPEVVNVLGTAENLDIQEIGDGNLNFVFRVNNADDASKSVIVKQAVPYLRMAGESWPLGRDRMRYEIRALLKYNEIVPNLVPKIFHADESMSTMVMQCLNDHTILRGGMIDGIKYPKVGEHIGCFMAETLFKTSAWSLGSQDRRELMEQFVMNAELCKLTEDFIFTFPFSAHESNYSNATTDKWLQENIHNDYDYKSDVLALKELFVSKSEALVHGDLHSGSLMVNQQESYVIDMEFAFFGPISFDVGKIFSNFLLCYTSHFHHSGGKDYQQWLVGQIDVMWRTFESRFLSLWESTGNTTMFTDSFFNEEEYAQYRAGFMKNLLQEAVGFAACSVARRTVGIAGVADIRDIEDPSVRASLEITNLKLSKELMSKRKMLNGIDDLLDVVSQFYSKPVL